MATIVTAAAPATEYAYVVFPVGQSATEMLAHRQVTEQREAMRIAGQQYEFLRMDFRKVKNGKAGRASTSVVYQGHNFRNYNELAVFLTTGYSPR